MRWWLAGAVAVLFVVLSAGAIVRETLGGSFSEDRRREAEASRLKLPEVVAFYEVHADDLDAAANVLVRSELECRTHGPDPRPLCIDPRAEIRVGNALANVEYDALLARSSDRGGYIDILLSAPDPWQPWGSGLRLSMDVEGNVRQPGRPFSGDVNNAFAPLGESAILETDAGYGDGRRNRTAYLAGGWYAYEFPYYD